MANKEKTEEKKIETNNSILDSMDDENDRELSFAF